MILIVYECFRVGVGQGSLLGTGGGPEGLGQIGLESSICKMARGLGVSAIKFKTPSLPSELSRV